MKPTIKREILANLIREFPKASTRTLASKAFKENPAVFDSAEHARDTIRHIRGAHGKSSRPIPDLIRPKQPGDADPFDKIPDGIEQLESWNAVGFDGPMKVLVLPDIHLPYHDKPALVHAIRYGWSNGADAILLNGDTFDFFSISFWEKDPRRRNFPNELKICGEFLNTLREMFPKARIIFKEGNHEERYPRYMRVRAPELLGVSNFEIPELLKFEDKGVEWVCDKRPIRLGQLNVLHGHEYNFAISNPVNPARGFFLRSKVLCLGSHMHQTSQHSEKDLEEKVVSTWSTGCLCDLHPEYRPINNWNHGFAFIEVFGNGAFEVQNLRIIDGKVYR